MSFWDTETNADGAGPGDPAPDPSDGGSGRERAGGLVAGLVVLGLVLLVGAGWVAAYYAAADNVPRGASVEGVAIGGRSPEDAVRDLEQDLSAQETAPVVLQVGDREVEVDPVEAGLTVDHEASVGAVGGGRSWDPRRLWDYYTGGDDVEAVVDVDRDALDAALAAADDQVGRAAEDGAVALTPSGPEVTQPVNGTTLEPGPAREAVLTAFLDPEPTAEVDLATVVPDIDRDDVRAALEDFADPAFSAPVTLRFDGSPVRLTPAELAPALALEAEDGELVPTADADVLGGLVDARVAAEGGDPVDASFEVVGGEPRVVPARPGVAYQPADVAAAVLDVLVRPQDRRTADVPASVDQPDLTTQEAGSLGVEEVVSDFSTYYPDADYRNVNLGRAAELIDGTLLEPGETFSLNGTVGERTIANGFTEGYVISDGILVEDLGGGVSQMATTLFNAMFFAGLEDVEHKPHSFYIDRYPVGREATVAWGVLDLRFRNDTDHGVLIKAAVTPSSGATQGEVNVTMYSTKTWDVRSRTSALYAYTSPTTRVLDTPDCYAYTGSEGFTVDVYRDFSEPGSDEVVRTEQFTTVYTPSDGVECVPPGSPQAD